MESATALLKRERPGEDEPRVDETPPAPPVAREEAVAFPVTRLESLGIFLLFAFAYTLIGWWIVADLHVVNFDALDRLTRAFMVWYNDPPKLASIGFALPPISSFVLVPFTVVRDFVTSGLAMPLSSGVFAAGALVFVNRMFAMADMARGARLLIVLLVGINPMFAYYAMNGTGDAAYLFFAAFGLFCLIGWGRNGSARYLIGAGLAFAFAALAKYEFIFWTGLIAFLMAWTLDSKGRGKDEIEGSAIAFLAPISYALGIWIFFNAIVLGNPFEWISLAGNATPVNAVSSAATGFGLLDAIGNVLRIELIFPAALVAVPLLLSNFGGSRDTISIGLGLLILLNIGYSLVGAALEGSTDVIELRDALPGMIAGIAGFAWLYLRSPDLRPMIWGLMILLSVIALPTAWSQMKSYPHQNLEQAFTRAISSGDDQEGTTSRGGFEVGVAPERAMADFIDEQQIPSNEILTDNARTYGVIALNGRPELFFDRVDKGDDEWRKVLDGPVGQVEFMLVERSDADLVLERYPGAVEGEVPFLETVASNDRYALLRVVEGAEAGEPGGAGVQPTTPGQQGATGSAPPITQQPPSGSER